MRPRLVVDTFCEFSELLKPWTIGNFFDIRNHKFIPDVVYVIERQRFLEDPKGLRSVIEQAASRFVLSFPFEGSITLRNHLYQYNIADLVLSGKLLIIAGGDMSAEWPHMTYDLFATKFHNFEENIREAQRSSAEIFVKKDKPKKFLFLNGRARPHRKYLIEKLDLSGLLSQSIWSTLSSFGTPGEELNLWHDGEDLMSKPRPIHLLEPQYEVSRYRQSLTNISDIGFVKTALFNNEWGDIYTVADPYIDTYFSLVTETVFEYPYSFRTEKLWKPMAMGHPWLIAANQGYYRDLRALGFKTFDGIIDESFDDIANNQQRMEYIVKVVHELCNRNLSDFLSDCEPICKYNQQKLLEYKQKIKQDFPDRFFSFLEQHA